MIQSQRNLSIMSEQGDVDVNLQLLNKKPALYGLIFGDLVLSMAGKFVQLRRYDREEVLREINVEMLNIFKRSQIKN